MDRWTATVSFTRMYGLRLIEHIVRKLLQFCMDNVIMLYV
jgi:hypothetical protein